MTYKKSEILKNQDIFKSHCDCLVNPVNCLGISGKGLALAFKQKFPDNHDFYQEECQKGKFAIGKICAFYLGTENQPLWIVNFPTKDHWKNPSTLEYIQSGLEALSDFLNSSPMGLRSIAVPALGCGLGGLQSETVIPMIQEALEKIDSLEKAEIYLNQ